MQRESCEERFGELFWMPRVWDQGAFLHCFSEAGLLLLGLWVSWLGALVWKGACSKAQEESCSPCQVTRWTKALSQGERHSLTHGWVALMPRC